jgi:DNA-binding Xre family transcriptional regulator
MSETRKLIKDSLTSGTPKAEGLDNQQENPESVQPKEVESTNAEENNPEEKKPEERKRRVGRPSKVHKITKIHLILEGRGMTRKDLHEAIEAKYPDEPMSPDAVSRIVSGQREYYSTATLFRICGALGVTPNMVLDYEREIQ